MGGWEADWGGDAGKSVGRLEVGKLQGREWLGRCMDEGQGIVIE